LGTTDQLSFSFGLIAHPAPIALPVMQTAGAATKSSGHCIDVQYR
jgi:hypothetical protein